MFIQTYSTKQVLKLYTYKICVIQVCFQLWDRDTSKFAEVLTLNEAVVLTFYGRFNCFGWNGCLQYFTTTVE